MKRYFKTKDSPEFVRYTSKSGKYIRWCPCNYNNHPSLIKHNLKIIQKRLITENNKSKIIYF